MVNLIVTFEILSDSISKLIKTEDIDREDKKRLYLSMVETHRILCETISKYDIDIKKGRKGNVNK